MSKNKLRGRGGKLLASGHRGNISEVVCSPDGRRFVSVSWKGEIFFWEPWQSSPSSRLQADLGMVYGVDWLPDSSRVVVGGYMGIELWDADTGAVVTRADTPEGSSRTVRVSSDGRFVAVRCCYPQKTELLVLDIENDRLIQRYAFPHYHGMYSEFDFLPDSSALLHVGPEHRVVCRSLADGAVRWDHALALWVYALRVCSEGERFAIVAADGNDDKAGPPVRLHATDDGQRLGELTGFSPSYCNPLRFSPNGCWLASSAYPGDMAENVAIWNLDDGQILWKEKHAQLEGCQVCFTPDGTTLITAGNDKKIRYWDLNVLAPQGG